MKTTITFLLVFFAGMICTNIFGQPYLTNRQVFDFNVGDVIQTKGGAGTVSASGPPTYETKTILTKTYSKNQDSIVYSIKRETYSFQSCMDCDPVTVIDTFSFTVTKLEFLPLMDNQSACGIRDTIYPDLNNLWVWESLPKQDNSCEEWERLYHTVQYVEGVGGPFYTWFNPAGPAYFEYKLVYYKNEYGSWGTLFKPATREPFFKDYTWNDLQTEMTACKGVNCMGGTYYFTNSYHLGKDTAINLKNYHVLIDTLYANDYKYADTIGFVREEMKGKKIFLHSKRYNKEILLYDFTLHIGDEITVNKFWYPSVFEVTALDSIDYSGVKRLTISLSSDFKDTIQWIEGIGSNLGFMYIDYYEGLLLCVKNNEDLIYKNAKDFDCIKTGIIDAVNELEANHSIMVYPNPASEYVTIKSNELIETVELMDLYGNKIFEDHPHTSVTRISLLNFKKGVYLLEVNCQRMKIIIK